MNSHKFCSACEQQFTVVTRDDHPDREPQIKGPKWCFSGNHTTLPLAATDKRRCFPNTVALQVGPRLQEEIEALPRDVKALTIPTEATTTRCAWFSTSVFRRSRSFNWST